MIERQMRVLIGMPERGSWGGPGSCEPPFVEGLREIGVRVEEEVYVYGDKPTGTAIRRRASRVLASALELRRRVRRESFDVIHLNTSFDAKAVLRDTVTLSLLSSRRPKIFLKLHGSESRLLCRDSDKAPRALINWLARRLIGRVDGVGVLSSEEKENFVRANFDPAKIFVVKNAVENERFAAARDAGEFNRRHVLEPNVPTLLFISRFIPAKGLLDAVRACRVVKDRGYDFTLLCVGDGPARREAEAEAADLGRRARFFGHLPEAEAAEFYANSTMLVFPTYHDEGLPLVILYSVAAGMPIVTTPTRGAADYLREPDNCLWVEAKNPEQLAEQIMRLLDDAGLRRRIGENNRRLAQQFAPRIVAAEHLEIYRTIAGRN